ncbi:MAG: ROK family protein [Ardenticatenaceae bacterium]|nr:ROK family protein [Ardenticatenaceae bacterium]MCB9446553.1 ROK family protein [Ardenticatenaceae bacterium]
MQKGDRALIKKMNQQLVLRLIQSRGPIARRDIARMSGLSPASVTGITGEMIELGFVKEAGKIENEDRAGRRAIKLQLNPEAGYAVGVLLAKYKFTCVLTDLDANILHSDMYELPVNESLDIPYDPEAISQAISHAIDSLLKQAKIKTDQLMGIGIGINGIVDYEAGVSIFAPHYNWHNVPLAASIAEYFGIPVHLENDARSLTIAEQLFGVGRDVDHFVAVAVGYGIGAGIVTNGQIYRGGSGGAGEFGHIVLQEDGPLCSCGKFGCLESLASVPAIFRQIEAAIASGETTTLADVKPLSLKAVTTAVKEGDAVAIRVVAEAGCWLGKGMATLVNILNPQSFIINGEAVCLGKHFLEPMEIAIRKFAFDGLSDSFRIVTEPGGTEVWAQGVASVVLNSLFASNDYDRLM